MPSSTAAPAMRPLFDPFFAPGFAGVAGLAAFDAAAAAAAGFTAVLLMPVTCGGSPAAAGVAAAGVCGVGGVGGVGHAPVTGRTPEVVPACPEAFVAPLAITPRPESRSRFRRCRSERMSAAL